MKILVAILLTVTMGLFINSIYIASFAQAQQGPSSNGGDALWHLPVLGESGWFLHAHNGRVRACNMNGASIVGDLTAPQCSNWR